MSYIGPAQYTATEDRDIVEGRRIGLSFDEIALLLNRPSGSSVRARYQILEDRLPGGRRGSRPTRQIRKCLGADCGKSFKSSGPGNRMCDGCRKVIGGRAGSESEYRAVVTFR